MGKNRSGTDENSSHSTHRKLATSQPKADKKIFVEGLPFHKTAEIENNFYALCTSLGLHGVTRLVQKKGYGFGYLVFRSASEAAKAIQILHGAKFEGRMLRVEAPKPPNKQSAYHATGQRFPDTFLRQILLSNLPPFVTQDILKDALRDVLPVLLYNEIEDIKLTRHNKAFVTMRASQNAEQRGKIQLLPRKCLLILFPPH